MGNLMAQVTADNFLPAHSRAARALLGWSTKELSERCEVHAVTIRRLESTGKANLESKGAILAALMDAGVEFTNGGKPGVRLTSAKP